MNKRLSPAFVELTHDALLKAFWYKPSLRIFLQRHGIAATALAQWHAEQSKRDYVAWLWPRLLSSEKGHAAILAMARALSEMDHFPDLERKEDTRIRTAEAKEAVARLRVAVSKIEALQPETREAADRRRASQAEAAVRLAARQSLEKLETALTDLMPLLGTAEGGYAFEKWFYDLAVFCELDARPGYRAEGRQIDGALSIEGTTFLVEAKFTNEPVGAPEIDIFMARIESKADNTMGIFVSMSGFNEGAIHAASKQRTPMLLLDAGHIMSLVLRGVMKLPQVISRIKRHASQTGSAYLPAAEF